MICALVENVIDLYAQGRLIAFEARWVESHAARCAACAARAAACRRLSAELKSLPVPAAPRELKAALKAALAAARPAPSSEDFLGDWRPVPAPSLALALGGVAFFLSASISIFGPGVASQSCASGDDPVCVLSAAPRGNL